FLLAITARRSSIKVARSGCFTSAIVAFIFETAWYGVRRSMGAPGCCSALAFFRISRFSFSSLTWSIVRLPFITDALISCLNLSVAGLDSWARAEAAIESTIVATSVTTIVGDLNAFLMILAV